MKFATFVTLLKIPPITQNEVPFMNKSEAAEKVEWRNRERQRGKEYTFSWVFQVTGVVQTCQNFWIDLVMVFDTILMSRQSSQKL